MLNIVLTKADIIVTRSPWLCANTASLKDIYSGLHVFGPVMASNLVCLLIKLKLDEKGKLGLKRLIALQFVVYCFCFLLLLFCFTCMNIIS